MPVVAQQCLDFGTDLNCFGMTCASLSSDGFHAECVSLDKLRPFTDIPGNKLKLLSCGLCDGENIIDQGDNPNSNGIVKCMDGGCTQIQSTQSNVFMLEQTNNFVFHICGLRRWTTC